MSDHRLDTTAPRQPRWASRPYSENGQQDRERSQQSSRIISPICCVSSNQPCSPCLSFLPSSARSLRPTEYLNPKFCFYHTIEKSIFQTCQKASTLQFASFRSLMFWTIAAGTEKPHFSHRNSEHLHVVPALSGDTSLTVSLTRKERCEG